MNEATMYRKINKFMKKYQLSDSYPIQKLLRDLNIKLIPYDSLDIVHLMAISEDAFSVYDGGKRYIFYNNYQPATRRHFTLSHELGHFVFEHHQKANNAVLAYGAHGIMEAQANIFARNLLMPVDEVLAYGNTKTSRELAELFEVSHQMATIRLERLEYDKRWFQYLQREKERVV